MIGFYLPDPPAATAPAKLQTVEDYAQAKQNFYPIGHGDDANIRVDFYALGGPLSMRNLRPVARAAALMNVTQAPDGPFQIVEIGTLTCRPAAFRATFRIVFDTGGHLLDSTGPVKDPAGPANLMTPEAVTAMSAIICDGQEPPDRIDDKDLSFFRAPNASVK